MKKILLIFIIPFLILSCTDFETKTDINNKFSIDIPKNWSVQNTGNEHLSMMQFADTTKSLPNRILFGISWESDKTKFTPDFKNNMDSITISKGWIPKNQIFQNVNGYTAYYFDVIVNDSLGRFQANLDNRYLNQVGKDGTIFLTITNWKKKMSKTDSILTEKIFKSLVRE